MLAIEHRETVKKPSPRTVSGPSRVGQKGKEGGKNDEMKKKIGGERIDIQHSRIP